MASQKAALHTVYFLASERKNFSVNSNKLKSKKPQITNRKCIKLSAI